MMYQQINDEGATPAERLGTLREYLATGPAFPEFVPESNNHVHTIYSFSPYAPAGAALRAREAGLGQRELAVSFPGEVGVALGLDIDMVLQQDPIDWTARPEVADYLV